MRRRIALALAFLAVSTVGVVVGRAGTGGATDDHRDLLINWTRTVAASGPFERDRLMLWGAGTWSLNPGEKPVIRGGFVHRRPNGRLVAQGFWKATGVVSYESYGIIPDTPLEGGRLVLAVTFYEGGKPVASFDDFEVVCLVGEPPEGVEEGVSVASAGFTEKVQADHRFTLFFQI